MKQKILLLVFLLCAQLGVSQERDWKYKGQANLGLQIALYRGKLEKIKGGEKQRFPGLKMFVSGSINGVYKKHLIVNYGASVSLYTKSLGANLNPLVGDIQIDLINSLTLGAGYDNVTYYKNFRTITNAYYYNISHDYLYAYLISTSFVLNNHKRNQVVGAMSLTLSDVTLNYYNDGAWGIFGIGDYFDRYWTGGGGVFVHMPKGFNHAELTFDQFTGYSSLLYELSNVLGVDVPDYNLADNSKTEKARISPDYNTSAYNLKIQLVPDYSFDIGIIGSLRDKYGSPYGIQDIIHATRKFALHPNHDVNRYYFGGTFNRLVYADL